MTSDETSSVASPVEKVERSIDGHVGEIPDYLVLKTQEMMAKEVMPHFREKVAPTPLDQPLKVAH